VSSTTSLKEQIVTAINDPGLELPVFSRVAAQVLRLLATDDYAVKDLERLIRSDQTLVSDVLRAANSSFYGGLAPVSTVQAAGVRLGGQQLASLIMLAAEGQRYAAADNEVNRLMRELWRHAMGTAMAAQWLAKKLGYTEILSESFVAGLIHDIGMLAILKVLDALKKEKDLHLPAALVLQVLESMHAEQGYLLARKWSLPENYCLVVRDHHVEEFDQSNVLLAIVRLSNQACIKLGIGIHADASLELPVTPEAQLLNVGDVLLAELEVMLEDALLA